MTTHLLIFLSGFLFARWTAAEPVDVIYGPETTVYEEPLLEDGRVDYLAIINAEMSRGVEPADNAYIDLLASMPADALPSPAWRAEALQLLGVGEDALPPEAVLEVDWLDAEVLEVVHRPWKAQEQPRVAKWLADNEAALDRLVAGSKKPDYYAPLVTPEEPPLLNVFLPALAHSRRLANAFRARAELRIGEGNLEAAWEDVMTVKRWSRLTGEEPTLIGLLVAMSLDSVARSATLDVLASSELSPELAARVQADLRALPAMVAPSSKIGEMERYLGLDLVQWVHEGRLPRLFEVVYLYQTYSSPPERRGVLEKPPNALICWDVNATLRTMNRWYDRSEAIGAAETPREATRLADAFDRDMEAWVDSWRERVTHVGVVPRAVLTPGDLVTESVTTTLVGISMPAMGSAEKTHWKARQLTALQAAAAAVARYRVEHEGRYPATLAALVPKYVDLVPLDMYSGEPLGYHVEEDGRSVRLWSVGSDFEDDGGREDSEVDDREGDLVVRLGAGEN